MPCTVVIGAQWGDEGKGKITDLLAEKADVVVRFQGGNNAGHTIVRDGEEFRPGGLDVLAQHVMACACAGPLGNICSLRPRQSLLDHGLNRSITNSQRFTVVPAPRAERPKGIDVDRITR